MICEKCNEKNATIHFTQIVNGKKKEIHLCEGCANKEENINFNMDFSIPFSMKDILNSMIEMGGNKDFYKEEKLCDQCKSTYSRFKETGRVGCYKCYDTFKEEFIPLIKRIQGSTEHVGKVPRKIGGPLKIRKEIKSLREDLNKAIGNEEFEEAAKLRDKIKELEKEL